MSYYNQICFKKSNIVTGRTRSSICLESREINYIKHYLEISMVFKTTTIAIEA